MIVRRDTREKIIVSLDEIETKLGEVLEQMQNDMLERAKKHLEEHTVEGLETGMNSKPTSRNRMVS